MRGILSEKDIWAGLSAVAIGVVYALTSLKYQLGSAASMGPGFVPLVLGIALTLLGVGIFVTALFKRQTEALSGSAGVALKDCWLAAVVLPAAIILFGLSIDRLGLFPATFLAIFVSTFADRRISLVKSMLIATIVSIFCVLLFGIALGLQIQTFMWEI